MSTYPIPAGVTTPCEDAPDLFFPDRVGSVQAERAKEKCGACPYVEGCLNWAVTRGEEGIWGGTDERDRRRICQRRGIVPQRPVLDLPRADRSLIVHGTAVGVEYHQRHYQSLCDECSQFNSGRYAGRRPCGDCGTMLLPASVRKHARYCR